MSDVTRVTPALDEFHYFKKLPAELRIKIWKLARPGSRIIRIGHVDSHPHPFTVKVPAILHACRESRDEGLKMYDLVEMYWRTSYDRHVEQKMIKHALYFDGSRDILFVDGDLPPPMVPYGFLRLLNKVQYFASTNGTSSIKPSMCSNGKCITFTRISAPKTMARVAKLVGIEELAKAFPLEVTHPVYDSPEDEAFWAPRNALHLASLEVKELRRIGCAELQVVLDNYHRAHPKSKHQFLQAKKRLY